MALVTKDYVTRTMKDKGLKHFTVKDSDGKSVIGDNHDEDTTVEKSAAMLEELLEEVSGTYVYVNLSEKTKRQKGAGGNMMGDYNFKVKLHGDTTSISGHNPNSSNYYKQLADLQIQLAEIKKDHEIERLKMEFEEFKKEKSNPMMDAALGHLINIMSGSHQTQQAVTASPGIHGTGDDAQSRMKSALKRLSKVDKNLAETLVSLANFAEKNPKAYHNYLPMLKNM